MNALLLLTLSLMLCSLHEKTEHLVWVNNHSDCERFGKLMFRASTLHSFDKTKFSCFTPPPMQHNSFFRNLKFVYVRKLPDCLTSANFAEIINWIIFFSWVLVIVLATVQHQNAIPSTAFASLLTSLGVKEHNNNNKTKWSFRDR